MPWRLIIVVLLMGLVIFFVGFNIENRADVSFGFHVFHDVPIFISLFVAFLAGVVVMLPFTLGLRRRKKEKKKKKEAQKELPPGEEGSGKGSGGFLKKKRKADKAPTAGMETGTPGASSDNQPQ